MSIYKTKLQLKNLNQSLEEQIKLLEQFVNDLGTFELEVYQSTNYANRFVSITLTSLYKEIKDIQKSIYKINIEIDDEIDKIISNG